MQGLVQKSDEKYENNMILGQNACVKFSCRVFCTTVLLPAYCRVVLHFITYPEYTTHYLNLIKCIKKIQWRHLKFWFETLK